MRIWILFAGIAVTAGAAEPVPAPAAPPPAAASQTLEPRVDTSAPTAPAAASRPAGTRGVRDRLELDTTQITGNRELPRVMYVVPWKRSDLGDVTGKPVNSLLDEVLEPVDRDVFRRQNRYFEALQPNSATPASKPEK